MSSLPIKGKIVRRGGAVRDPLLSRGTVIRQQATIDPVSAQNVPNQPEYGSSQNEPIMPISMHPYKLDSEPILPSVSSNVLKLFV